MLRIENQVKSKVSMKRGIRKKVKRLLERIHNKISYKIFYKSNIKEYQGDSSLGCDEKGRDIESGIKQYVRVLKDRNLKIHTLLVLGSRVKGRWTPKSDVDVTIITSSLPKQGSNLISKRLFSLKIHILYSDMPLFLGVEPSVCLTREEFIKRLEQFEVESLDAILYGKVIYDDGFLQMARSKYADMEKRLGLDQVAIKEKLILV